MVQQGSSLIDNKKHLEKDKGAAARPSPVSSATNSHYWYPSIIVAAGVSFRLLYLTTFRPCWAGDSEAYTYPWLLWAHHFFSEGARPPLYPLFLGLGQWIAGTEASLELSPHTAQVIVCMQSVLGVCSALFLYYTLGALRIRPRIAFYSSIAFALIGGTCLFELFVLSECLSLFFIVLTSFLFVKTVTKLGTGSICTISGASTGLAAAAAVLVRPENLLFVTVLLTAVFVIYYRLRTHGSQSARSAGKLTLVLLCSFLPLVIGWMSINCIATGELTLSTLSGWVSSESVYNLYSGVDDEDRVLGKILEKSYRDWNHDGQVYRHHIWRAFPEITAHKDELPIRTLGPATPPRGVQKWLFDLASDESRRWVFESPLAMGYSPVVMNHYVGSVTWKLRRKFPAAYVHNVSENFLHDTFDFQYATPSKVEMQDPRAVEGGNVVRVPALWAITNCIGIAQAPLLTLSYVIMLGYVVCTPVIFKGRDEEWFIRKAAVSALAFGTLATIGGSCLVAAYYPQHGEPFLAVLVTCVAFAADNFKQILNSVRTIGS